MIESQMYNAQIRLHRAIMENVLKLSLSFSLVMIFINSTLGQELKSKVFAPDNLFISKNVIQRRNITNYFDGGAFRCGFSSVEGECNYNKIRSIIWQCWSEKKLCYLTIQNSSVDEGGIEHIFVEPDKTNQWLIVRRTENYQVNSKLGKPIHNLPIVYSIEWNKSKPEQILIFKNKLGKVIEEF